MPPVVLQEYVEMASGIEWKTELGCKKPHWRVREKRRRTRATSRAQERQQSRIAKTTEWEPGSKMSMREGTTSRGKGTRAGSILYLSVRGDGEDKNIIE